MHTFAASGATALALLLAAPAAAQPAGSLTEVATFPTQQITGVSVSRAGRVFVNLPRWTVDVPVSVGEVKDGRITPFPDAAWNGYRNTSRTNQPGSQFVCVQSVVVDHGDNLWVLDPASPGQEGPVKGGPKLVRIDLKTNKVTRILAFDEKSAPPGSYLNDVRFSPDDAFAYMTDSGVKGALVVADLRSGRSWRVLDGDPSTQVDRSVTVTADGAPLRRPDGRQPQFAADGIALSPDGGTLYWQALTGETLYSVSTAALRDPSGAAAVRATAVAKTHVTDGLWMDREGRLYLTNPGASSIEVAERPGAPLRTLAQDARLRWPDTFSQGPDGAIYVTASHIQDSPWFKPQATTTPSAIFKVPSSARGR